MEKKYFFLFIKKIYKNSGKGVVFSKCDKFIEWHVKVTVNLVYYAKIYKFSHNTQRDNICVCNK